MGLFSSKKKTYVSSIAYNMAGEFSLRPNYLKTTVFRGIMTNAPSLGEHIVDGQFGGPNIDQRLFFRWARSYYPEGAVSGQISNYQNLNAAQVVTASSAITVPEGEDLQVVMAFLDDGEMAYWAERHILEYEPDLFETEWLSDYNDETGELNILYEDLTEEFVSVPDFNPDSTYLYVYYNTVTGSETSPYVVDSTTSNEATRPDDTDFVQESIVNTVVTETLQDGDAVTTREEEVTDYEEVLLKDVNMGTVDNAQVVEHHRLTIWKRHRVIETAPDYEEIEVYFDSQLEISETTSGNTGNRQLFIYEIGSGNVALDNLKVEGTTFQEFFPIIPLRRYNKPIDHVDYADDFAQFKKAYKKSIGGKIEDILQSIEDNESIDDVDHCFLTFGPEINTEHREGKRYTYEFFKSLMAEQTATITDVNNWASSQSYVSYQEELAAWQEAQSNFSDPDYGTPRPVHVSYAIPDFSTLEIKSTNEGLSIPYNTKLEWMAIDESAGVGLGKAGAKKNDFWWEVMPDILDPNYVPPSNEHDNAALFFLGDEQVTVNHVRLYWQKTDSTYTYIDVYGMRHINKVYDGKTVEITAKEGIEDTDESGFVVPMHYGTMKKLPLMWLNELGIQNRILVFNSYQVVEQKWWQRGVFKIVFAIVIAVVAALVFPGAVGLLGSHLALGTSLGFTGTAALVAGAVVNAIAAIALSQALSSVAVSLFGEKWGGVIAAIAGLVIGNMASSFHAGNGFTMNWGTLTRADVLLSLTDSVAKGVQGYASGEITDLAAELEKIAEEHDSQMDEISELFMELGYSGIDVDPLMWTQQENSGKSFESSDTFIQRTLLTGSDIAELTLTMLTDFTELSLTLPEPIA